MQSVNEYLVIEIAATDVCVPIADARTDVAAKKHVSMFLSPYTNGPQRQQKFRIL